MIPKLESVEYVAGYTIHVRFEDGIEGHVDLTQELWGEVFEPLKDIEMFRQLRLYKELNTVTWPSGADLAPEFLYDQVVQQNGTADRPVTGG